jgi:hypothetical protein
MVLKFLYPVFSLLRLRSYTALDMYSEELQCPCRVVGLVTLQAAMCAAQCSFRHALLQYSTLLHARTAPASQAGAAAVGATRARAAAALASPGRVCARTRGSGARRRAALSRAGRMRDGLRLDRHGRGVGKELFHGALEHVALGDQRRDGGGERSSRA